MFLSAGNSLGRWSSFRILLCFIKSSILYGSTIDCIDAVIYGSTLQFSIPQIKHRRSDYMVIWLYASEAPIESATTPSTYHVVRSGKVVFCFCCGITNENGSSICEWWLAIAMSITWRLYFTKRTRQIRCHVRYSIAVSTHRRITANVVQISYSD